jgi:DNA-binding NarL/FixJ family response regulator
LRLLIDILLATGQVEDAKIAADQLAGLAESVRSDLLLAQSDMAKGQILRLTGQPGVAERFQSAIDRLQKYEGSLLAGRAKLEMARLLVEDDPAAAVVWARAARAAFERIGSTHDSAEAEACLREMGVASRPGPRSADPLTQREAEVLALMGQGLSNREIADRLVISPKTVEHHVSRVLSKLGARTRTEAVAFSLGQKFTVLK